MPPPCPLTVPAREHQQEQKASTLFLTLARRKKVVVVQDKEEQNSEMEVAPEDESGETPSLLVAGTSAAGVVPGEGRPGVGV